MGAVSRVGRDGGHGGRDGGRQDGGRADRAGQQVQDAADKARAARTGRARMTGAPTGPPTGPPLPRRSARRGGVAGFARRCALGLGLALALAAAGLGAAVVFMTGGRVLPVPDLALDRIEARVSAAADGQASLSIGGAAIWFDTGWRPGLRLRGLEVRDRAGAAVAVLPDLRATFDLAALRGGRVVPRTLRIDGAEMLLRREVDGAFDLLFGGGARMRPVGSLAEALDAVDALFDIPALAGVERVSATGLRLTLDDARAERIWQVGGGVLTLERRDGEVAVDLGITLDAPDGGAPATAALSFVSQRGTPEARIRAELTNIRAADIAAQDPSLGWLAVIDAPISGAFTANVDRQGQPGIVHGDLALAAGALRPRTGAPAIPFTRAALSLDFDPRSERIGLTGMDIESPQLRLRGRGHIDPEQPGMMTGGSLPDAFIGQFRLEDVRVDPEGLFEEPVRFAVGMADIRLGIAPLRVDIGQVALIDGARRLDGHGWALARDDGWQVSADLTINEMDHDRVLALWPPALVAATRRWVAENVSTGTLYDISAALRLHPGRDPVLAVAYEFRDATARFLRALPPVEGASGYAAIRGQSYTTGITAGHVTAPQGGRIDVAGSVFRVPDITLRPGRGEVTLRSRSSVTAALSLIDRPPFAFLTKAGLAVDIAEGTAEVEGTITVPLVPGLTPGDVRFSGTGRLTDIRSGVLVPGHVLAARRLDLQVDNDGIEITGAGTLSDVPFAATWAQEFGPEAAGQSRVRGTIELSPRFAQAFGIGLPAGMIAGAAAGRVEIDLARDAAPAFRLTSDLDGLAMRIAPLAWAKPAARTGTFEAAGRLSSPPQVEVLRLDAPGLQAEGRVDLTETGALAALDLGRVRAGGWLDAPVVLRPRGGAMTVAVTGGRIDLGQVPAGLGQGGGAGNNAGGGGAPVPITLALDRLTVSDGIALTRFRGEFSTAGGFSGRFEADVNGAAPVTGSVAPAGGRAAVRLRAADAGAVLRAADIVQTVRGGAMELILVPRGDGGDYDGTLTITDTRVVDAPVLAAMLNAISVVGILERLGGEGLAFAEVQAAFRLTSTTVEVSQGSAVGASLGVSLSGTYGRRSRRMEFQGVFSPVYLVNSIGSMLTRRGEGVFGFNYAVSGTVDAPRVSVNPLSIFTPSMFREIFRRPLPRIAQ